MKLKLDDKGAAIIQDGKPVYVHDDGKEVAFDAPAMADTIKRLNYEAMQHREAKESLEGKLKLFEGIEDPAKALKALEPAALALGPQTDVALAPALEGFSFSADRAGALMCGDVSVALTLVLRDDPNAATQRLDTSEPLLQALRERGDLQQLLLYVLSDDFLRLRQRLGLALP